MEHIGAGLAALGVFGPGIGIGILGGLAATAIGRNPDAAAQIRGLAIILGRRSPKASASWRSSSACWPSSSSSGRRSWETIWWICWPSSAGRQVTG